MKVYKRILLTIPFALVTYYYCKFNDPDAKCVGIADAMLNFVFFALLIVTIVSAFIGTLRNRQNGKLTFEPISFTIIIATIGVLIYNFSFRGHTTGDKWLYAQTKMSPKLATQNIILRKNGNFTINLMEVDFGCSISGRFRQNGDTIVLEQAAIDKTSKNITATYLLTSDELIPVIDTLGKFTFEILTTK